MWQRLLDLVAPFGQIAQELRILRELYELDLSSRTPPIIRVTETPRKDDTTVSYGTGEETEEQELKRELADAWNGYSGEEESEG